MPAGHNFLGLDLGTKRVGIALASSNARLAAPFKTINNDDSLFEALRVIIDEQQIGTVVVGLPRGLDGQDTPQTAVAKTLAAEITHDLEVKVVFQDEAGTSVQAKVQLDQAGKAYHRGDIDSLAAVYILTDYLNTGR